MAYLKRNSVPKNWSVPRKGRKYIITPESNLKLGIPVLVLLRDLLKIARNRKEVKKVIHEKALLLNGKKIKSEGQSLTLFDILTIVPSKENYQIYLNESGKLYANKINESQAKSKISKIIKKTKLKGNKLQINLSDGRNFIYDKECKTNDSVLIDFNGNKIQKILPFKEKAKILVFAGKHAGQEGEIVKIDNKHMMVEVKNETLTFNALIKQSIVVG